MRQIPRERDVSVLVRKKFWLAAFGRLRHRSVLCRDIVGRVGSVKPSQAEGLNFGALEFSSLVSEIPSPTAFTGA